MAFITLTISLNNRNKTYSPGEIVSGNVIIESNWTATYRGLQLKFSGEGSVYWRENTREGNETRAIPYYAQEEYLRSSMYLFGSPADCIQVDAGRAVVPFSFQLPMGLPSSFYNNPHKFDLGGIEYAIEAILDGADGSDYKKKIVFFVMSPLDLSQYPTVPIVDEGTQNYCCCLLPCISRGSMNASIRASGDTYAVGEDIVIFVDIECNSKTVHVTSVNAKLEQRITFTARTPGLKHKHVDKVIAMCTREGPLPSSANLELKMNVPSVDHTGFQYCAIIAIKYLLKVEICVSGCHSNTRREYDIVIGARPKVPANTLAPSVSLIGVTNSLSSRFPSSGYLAPLPGNQLNAVHVPYPCPAPVMGFANPTAPAVMIPEDLPPPYRAVMMQGDRRRMPQNIE